MNPSNFSDTQNQRHDASSPTVQHQHLVLPGSTIGILGGGQLGRMMILAGRQMGYGFATLDPTRNSPAGQVSDIEVVSEFTNMAGAEELAEHSDVITYEFENVSAEVAHRLEECAYVPQGSGLLQTTQHRVREKAALLSTGARVADYRPLYSLKDLQMALLELQYPCILKTSFGGYDGKGQWLIKTPEEIDSVWSEIQTYLPAHEPTQGEDAPLVLEQVVPFMKELSVIVARNVQGEVQTFPVAENIHQEHILHLSIVPAGIPPEVSQHAQELATAIASGLNLVGVMGVEMFYLEDGSLVVNELAPRPHNSGHYTMDACATSQFEQHIRAICGLPLGHTTLWSPVVMVNILGEHVSEVMRQMPYFPDNVKVHFYGKAEVRDKRKMGHINITADSTEDALSLISQLGIW